MKYTGLLGAMTQQEFIDTYVGRARRVGFHVSATSRGCYYYPNEEMPAGQWMEAKPCDCGCEEKWAMFDVMQRPFVAQTPAPGCPH